MNFTLVSTVFNEAKRLSQTIADLTAQTLQPSEIIITDAGSTDGTYNILLEWKRSSTIPIIILQKLRCNVAEGRNLAIRAASCNLIASTDFGCRFHPQWLESIITPFVDSSVEVAGGAYTVEESQQNTIAAKAAYVLSNGYQTDVTVSWFIPSSRSIAYKKYVFDTIGGYCEWLTLAADDLVFGKEIAANGYKMVMINKPYVFWGRHTLSKGFIKEANRYGLGDGEAKVNLRNFASNAIQLIMRFLFILCLLLFVINTTVSGVKFIYLIIFLFLVVGFRPYIGYIKSWLTFRSAKYDLHTFLYGIYLLEATRISYVKGFLKGYIYATDYQKEQAELLHKRLKKV